MKTSKPSSYHRTSKPYLFPKTKLACVIFYCFENRNFRFHLILSDWSNIQIWNSTRPIVPGNNFINIILLSDPYHPAVKRATRITYQNFYYILIRILLLDYRFKQIHFLRKIRLKKDLFFFLAPWPMFCLSPSIVSTFSGLEGRADAVSTKPTDCSLEICSAGPKWNDEVEDYILRKDLLLTVSAGLGAAACPFSLGVSSPSW